MIHFKNTEIHNSLVVHRLGLCALTAKGPGLIPGWELRSHMSHGVTKRKKMKNTGIHIHYLQGMFFIRDKDTKFSYF